MVENTVGKNEKESAVFVDSAIEDTFVSFCTGKLFAISALSFAAPVRTLSSLEAFLRQAKIAASAGHPPMRQAKIAANPAIFFSVRSIVDS